MIINLVCVCVFAHLFVCDVINPTEKKKTWEGEWQCWGRGSGRCCYQGFSDEVMVSRGERGPVRQRAGQRTENGGGKYAVGFRDYIAPYLSSTVDSAETQKEKGISKNRKAEKRGFLYKLGAEKDRGHGFR